MTGAAQRSLMAGPGCLCRSCFSLPCSQCHGCGKRRFPRAAVWSRLGGPPLSLNRHRQFCGLVGFPSLNRRHRSCGLAGLPSLNRCRRPCGLVGLPALTHRRFCGLVGLPSWAVRPSPPCGQGPFSGLCLGRCPFHCRGVLTVGVQRACCLGGQPTYRPTPFLRLGLQRACPLAGQRQSGRWAGPAA